MESRRAWGEARIIGCLAGMCPCGLQGQIGPQHGGIPWDLQGQIGPQHEGNPMSHLLNLHLYTQQLGTWIFLEYLYK